MYNSLHVIILMSYIKHISRGKTYFSIFNMPIISAHLLYIFPYVFSNLNLNPWLTLKNLIHPLKKNYYIF